MGAQPMQRRFAEGPPLQRTDSRDLLASRFSTTPSPGHDDIPVEYIQSAEVTGGKLQASFTPTLLASLKSDFSPVFLGITTDVARKGLPILLSEWCDYLPARNKRSLLLLKLSSINVTKSVERLREEVLSMLAPFWRKSLGQPDIAFIFGSHSEAQVASLYANSDAYITATLGEGFGGPLIECLLNNTAYISPRHTSLAELIPPSYPFILQSEPASVILRDNLPVYSLSSTWHIVSRGAIARALQEYEETTPVERRATISAKPGHMPPSFAASRESRKRWPKPAFMRVRPRKRKRRPWHDLRRVQPQ